MPVYARDYLEPICECWQCHNCHRGLDVHRRRWTIWCEICTARYPALLSRMFPSMPEAGKLHPEED